MSTLESIEYILFFEEPITIRRCPFFYFEVNIRSQKVSGYSLYMMHRFFYAKYMTYRESLIDITAISITSDDDSDVNYSITLTEVAQSWGLLSNLLIKAWRYRATRLNRRPPVRRIDGIPTPVRNAFPTQGRINKLLCSDIEGGWCRFRTQIEKYLFSKRRRLHVRKPFIAGKEWVRRGKHLYLEMYLCLLLIITIFGWKLTCVTDEVVHKSSNVSVIYIPSTRRAQEVFYN